MATSDGFPIAIVATFTCVYFLVFLLSIAGNSFVLCLCFKLKRPPCSLKWFIANLAVADLAFTTLSILDLINFLWTWIGGQFSCKAQSFVIETCYTTSIMTLVLISFERLQAVVEPFSVRFITTEGAHRKLIAMWISSIIIASPLLYAYQAQVDASGTVFCTDIKFGDMGRQIYYSIHAVCFFIFPLIYMIYAQWNIFLSLRSGVFPTQNSLETGCTVQRHHKVARILAALTVAFAICWSPFVVVRTLMYFHLTDGGYIWRASQLLILLNTALDPILYGIYGANFKRYLLGLFKCTNFQPSTRKETFGREKRKRQRTDIVHVEQVYDLNVLELVDKWSSTRGKTSPNMEDRIWLQTTRR